MSGILDGITVLDTTQDLAGPMATRLLAEAGATVVKIEPPEGDRARRRSPSGFAAWNRSKDGLVLDLSDDAGRAELLRLMAGADVFVHDLPARAAVAAGLDDQSLLGAFPELVVASVTDLPFDHPEAGRYQDELLVQAWVGLLDETDRPDGGHPAFIGPPIAGFHTAYLLAAGILARLDLAARTGKGGAVHTSLAQGLWANLTMLWNRAEHPIPLLGPDVLRHLAWTSARECGDGEWIVQGSADIPAMQEALRSLEPAGDPSDAADLQRALRTRPAHEWVSLFGAADEQCMEVLRPGECLRYPQVVANRYVGAVDDPVWGATTQPGPPFGTEPPCTARGPAPVLGSGTGVPLGPRRRRATVAEPSDHPARYPLQGLRVLDLGMFLAGPFAPQCLADLGADVIKVEPATGDRMRTMAQTFVGCQRNKRSIALDLRDPQTRPVLEALVRWADVVHHNLRRPAALALGVDRDSVLALNPDVVFSHVSTYGPEGEMSDWPGVDHDGVAASGWMWEGTGNGNPPTWQPFGWLDYQCALSSLVATLLACYRRTTTGAGSAVTASLLGAATNTSMRLLLEDGTITPGIELDGAMTGTSPGYRLYECRDGWIAVAADANETRPQLRKAAGVSSDGELPLAFADLDVDPALSRLSVAGVPAARVAQDHRHPFYDDPTLRRLGYTVAYDHPEYGRFEQPGAYWTFGDLGVRLDAPPPLIGQHTEEVLEMVGVHGPAARSLLESGAAVATPGPGSHP